MQESRIIRTLDGNEIRLTCYLNGEPAEKVIVIGPSVEGSQEQYRHLARLLRSLDYDIITFDYRGIGSSEFVHAKKCRAALHQWAVQDADAVLRHVKNSFPNQEIIYIGHGVGGEIIGLAPASQYIHKLILINSALSCRKLWPLRDKLRLFGLIVFRYLAGYFPRGWAFSKKTPYVVLKEWIQWCENPNGLFDKYPDNNYRKLQVPLLAFSFSDDWHCPPAAVRELLSRYSSAISTWHHFKPRHLGVKKIGHSGFFDPQMKTTTWIMMEKWIRSSTENVNVTRRSG